MTSVARAAVPSADASLTAAAWGGEGRRRVGNQFLDRRSGPTKLVSTPSGSGYTSSGKRRSSDPFAPGNHLDGLGVHWRKLSILGIGTITCL